MESHDALVIKLRDCKPKALLFTRHILYQLLSSPTSRDYILATKNSGAVNICGFTCICEQSYVEFRTFFQFVSLSSVILKRKYNHKKFTYSKSFVRDMLGLGDDEGITEPKLIHEFSGDPYKCGIYISKSDSFDIENEYQSVLKITDSDCNTTFVSMVDSDYILQTFFHPYITILCANPPFDTINNFESGVTIAGYTYKFARHMLTEMCKIVQKISKESKSFDIFVTTIERLLLLAYKARPFSIPKPNQKTLLHFLTIYGTSIEPKTLLDIICVADCITICEIKFGDFCTELQILKKNYKIGISPQK